MLAVRYHNHCSYKDIEIDFFEAKWIDISVLRWLNVMLIELQRNIGLKII